jgi:hypothetical protein
LPVDVPASLLRVDFAMVCVCIHIYMYYKYNKNN